MHPEEIRVEDGRENRLVDDDLDREGKGVRSVVEVRPQEHEPLVRRD